MASHPSPDTELAASIAALRDLDYAGPALNGQHLVPGLFFSLDPAVANTVDVQSRPGELMDFRLKVDRPGAWLTLNMGVGSASFAACKIVGFACRLEAAAPATFRVCLRSGEAAGFRDVFFAKTVVAGPQTAVHLDVLEIATNPDILPDAVWRELVLFFPPHSCEINLRDFRLIVI